MQDIAKTQAELNFIKSSDNMKNLEALEQLLHQEEQNLHSLLTSSAQSNEDQVTKLQSELMSLDSDLASLKK